MRQDAESTERRKRTATCTEGSYSTRDGTARASRMHGPRTQTSYAALPCLRCLRSQGMYRRRAKFGRPTTTGPATAERSMRAGPQVGLAIPGYVSVHARAKRGGTVPRGGMGCRRRDRSLARIMPAAAGSALAQLSSTPNTASVSTVGTAPPAPSSSLERLGGSSSISTWIPCPSWANRTHGATAVKAARAPRARSADAFKLRGEQAQHTSKQTLMNAHRRPARV